MPFTSGYNTNCCQLEHSSTIRSVVIGGSACPLPPPPCSRVHSRRQHRNLPLRPPNKASDTKGPVAIVHVPCKGDDTLDKSSPSAWGGYRSFGSKLHDAYRRVLHRDLKRRLIAKSLLGADILSVAVCGLYAVITCTVQRSISMLSSDSPRRIFSATSQVSDTVVCQFSEVLGCLRGLRSPQVFCSRPKLERRT